jgi:hypothetical protein
MSDPADLEGPLILDSSVLVAYERVRAPRGDLREAQSLVATWLAAEVPLVVPVLSLLVAAHECQGELPEVDFLLASGPAAVVVVPLTRQSAPAVAAGALKIHPEALEVAHVIWCATGSDPAGPALPVATYWPDWYANAGIPVIPL